MRAGVFDSGVGGLTVLKSLLEYELFDEIIYFGDTARVPYGSKNPQTIVKYATEALDFFDSKNVDILIYACNSVSAYALEALQSRKKTPIFGVIEAGIKACSSIAKQNDHILVIGTKATISSKKYQDGLKKKGYENISTIPTALFVPLIEESILEGTILQEVMNLYFKPLTNEPNVIILGCTHYPMIEKQIAHYFPKAQIIHSGNALSIHLQQKLSLTKHSLASIEFYSSDSVKSLESTAKQWLNKKHHSCFAFYPTQDLSSSPLINN